MPSVEFDKFYTQKNVAKQCYDFLVKIYPNAKEEVFLEPSAGSGAFLEFLPKFLALDIKPEGKNITQCDFLDFVSEKKDYITIGNPPFGNRSDLAIKFFNKAAEISDIIAFIVPVSFMKWNVQKQLNKDFALVNYFYLEPESFLANNTYLYNDYYQNFLLTSQENRQKLEEKINSGDKKLDVKYE